MSIVHTTNFQTPHVKHRAHRRTQSTLRHHSTNTTNTISTMPSTRSTSKPRKKPTPTTPATFPLPAASDAYNNRKQPSSSHCCCDHDPDSDGPDEANGVCVIVLILFVLYVACCVLVTLDQQDGYVNRKLACDALSYMTGTEQPEIERFDVKTGKKCDVTMEPCLEEYVPRFWHNGACLKFEVTKKVYLHDHSGLQFKTIVPSAEYFKFNPSSNATKNKAKTSKFLELNCSDLDKYKTKNYAIGAGKDIDDDEDKMLSAQAWNQSKSVETIACLTPWDWVRPQLLLYCCLLLFVSPTGPPCCLLLVACCLLLVAD